MKISKVDICKDKPLAWGPTNVLVSIKSHHYRIARKPIGKSEWPMLNNRDVGGGCIG